jgi:hypothetical protein
MGYFKADIRASDNILESHIFGYFTFVILLSLSPLLPLWSMWLISEFRDHLLGSRTPWTGDQLAARPLPICLDLVFENVLCGSDVCKSVT